MTIADVAPASSGLVSGGVLLCAGLSCLFLLSAILLVVVLVRRNRRGPVA